jgi:DNA replication and repair protein RecF
VSRGTSRWSCPCGSDGREPGPIELLSVELCRFRNLAEVSLSPHPRFTILTGENGQGKTNFLEGVYYLLALRPLRSGRVAELIAHGEEHADLAARVRLEEVIEERRVALGGAGRLLSLNGKPADAAAFLRGSVVAFSPDELALVRGGPERRRRYLDRAVFNRWPRYLLESRDYLRLLRSRNRLLRERAPEALRESFDGPLSKLGAQLVCRRRALLEELEPRVRVAFREIGLSEAQLSLRYRGLGGTPEEIERALLDELRSRLADDQERGFTSVGPHVDDLSFGLGGHSARTYASQGQVRALVLALKVGEIENLRVELGFPPLLLLDDVSSELDPRRNRSFMAYLRGLASQVLLTTTDAASLLAEIHAEHLLFEVRGGEVKPTSN